MVDALKSQGQLSSYVELAEILNTNKAGINDLKNSRKKISIDLLKGIKMSYPQVNLEWILTGAGEMFSETPKEDLARDILSKGIPLISRNVLSLNNSKFLPDIIHERYAIPDFILRIKGDSMAPLLKPGHLVACEIVSELKNNHIHAISTRSMGIIIKYVSQENMPDHLTFISENKSYPPFNLPPSDIIDLALVTGILWPLDFQVKK